MGNFSPRRLQCSFQKLLRCHRWENATRLHGALAKFSQRKIAGILTLRAPRVLVPTPSTKGGGSKRTPPVSQEREMLQT